MIIEKMKSATSLLCVLGVAATLLYLGYLIYTNIVAMGLEK